MLHAIMRKADLLGELGAGPKRHSLFVKSGQEMAQGRPLHLPVAPNLSSALLVLPTVAQGRLADGGVVPIDLGFSLVAQEKLLPALLVRQPGTEVGAGIGRQVPLRSELISSAGNAIEVVKLHDFERVLLVEAHPIQGLSCLPRLLRRGERGDKAALCFGALRIVGHVLVALSILVDEFRQDVEELVVLLFGNLRNSCYEDGAWKAVVQSQGRLKRI
mmetsp:Transcript_63888/g.101585  ORF Transcript_63888/g.101585 Transcript_63888/m.101585 type:complete len:217 (+) Transcript_63888:1458-2108(+)